MNIRFLNAFRKKRITLLFCLSALLYIFNELFQKTPLKITDHFAIHLVIHYDESKFYENNTMVVLINTPLYFSVDQTIFCFSQNATSKHISTTFLRPAHQEVMCKWTTALFNCSTVQNPSSFGIAAYSTSHVISLPFQTPVREKLPVVGCFTPLYFEERWPTVIISIELYEHFGINRQIVYINSGLLLLIKMLKHYESKKFIKIEEYPMPQFDQDTTGVLGYDPILELSARNQPMAYNDCLMKYREAADFIIMVDVDDILIPFKTPNYFPEFQAYLAKSPNATAFIYFRRRAEFITTTKFGDFSLENALQSIRVSSLFEDGKSVYNPKLAETAWIHWPGQRNESTYTVPKSSSLMLHLANLKFSDAENIYPTTPVQRNMKIALYLTNNFTEISKMLSSIFHNTFLREIYADMHFIGTYAAIIRKCYDYTFALAQSCMTPSVCKIPNKIQAFKCTQIQKKAFSKFIDHNVMFYVPNSETRWFHTNDGCK